jgi:hypothetical protein
MVIAIVAYFVLKRRKKKLEASNTNEALGAQSLRQPVNYLSLRQSEARAIHGVSVYSFKFADTADTENSSSGPCDSLPFNCYTDLECEHQLTSAINALVSDGYTPHVNAVCSISRVIFYITY